MLDKIYDKAYLPISEFAEFVDLSLSTLQYYDNIGLFSPAKHGKGNKRLYSPTQITAIKMIRILTGIGVPLDTIKELASSRSTEELLKLLRTYKAVVYERINYLHEVDSVIDTYVGLLFDGISVTETEFTISEMAGKSILLGDANNYSGTVGFVREFVRFCHALHEPALNIAYPIGGYWENMESFLEEPSRPLRFFSLDPKGHDLKKAGIYLTGYTRGYYSQTNNLPAQLKAYANTQGLEFSGPVYNLYLLDELSTVDPSQYLLQVSVEVKETRREPAKRPHYPY